MSNLTLPGPGEASAAANSAPAAFARLPAVDRLLREPVLQGLVADLGHAWVKRAVQTALEEARNTLRAGGAPIELPALVEAAVRHARGLAAPRL
jgi:hypothetical protein